MLSLLLLAALGTATVTLHDSSDFAVLTADAADDALTANWDYTPTTYQVNAIVGAYEYSDKSGTIEHATLAVSANDTSVLVITEGSDVNVSYSTIVKHGYSSDLYQSSFFGLNAAVNVANESVANFDHVNVTVHNGAANIYSYGNNTYVSISDSSLYSSGPVSHGLYAAGYGTIVGRNLEHYSGAYRSSSFAGDSPQGYVYVYDSVAHTAGIGSAIIYGQGTVYAEKIVGYAERAPVAFLDTAQIDIYDSDLTAGLLAGAVVFSSGTRGSGSEINFTNSRLTVLPEAAAALWFGNVIASSHLTSTSINTTSGILVVANYSQVTQDFSYFADSTAAAEATVTISESDLEGDLVAYNGSSISWSLTDYSSWTGTAYSGYGTSTFAVSLDVTSTWTLTNDTVLNNFTDSDRTLSNVYSAGYTLYYDSSASANRWLNGTTKELTGGGSVTPATAAQLAG
ncbi:hypothetical protein AtubIFM55763_006528 [Aspergillus tubingensis]|uniref:Uncharacterized protein n=2 Tax=Aspergillus subgen. Circumdati TaxID=2720871 RepID=A0A8H3SY85_ASPTU|nr:glycosyl hydrolase family 43 protein [Aspergillus tubingensis]GAQ45084.1 similar to An08g10760 [Aspergillus niger]GFN18297.1 glycosyl hydrolase family 43 protein [Aspergillus tubingensis]GLA66580.1 hypothetical protein AtubIFM54640_009160 [Aspergillus tubingensis]GLA75260.1 hypothetical protein AtubIFM55763_006528 [Aspergillus tubingensis]GLA79237.1 hypothetical protein AtubIFM56815_000023 [Aspergillus tubingensis]